MSRPVVVALSGSLRRPSRTRTLVEAVGAEVARSRPIALRVADLVDAGPGLGAALSRNELSGAAAELVGAIEGADALIVGSPVYKGAYTGLFKHLFDLIEPEALAGKAVVLTATGGGPRHTLVVEHSLRPLFGFFTALTVPTAVYASDQDFLDGCLVNAGVIGRLGDAARQLAGLLDLQDRTERVEPEAPARLAARGLRSV
jgi:FMN reductase